MGTSGAAGTTGTPGVGGGSPGVGGGFPGVGGGFPGVGGGFPGVGGSSPTDGGSAGTSGADALMPAPVICGNGIVEAGESCDGPFGCPDGQSCTDTCTCAADPPAAPTTVGLIENAYETGAIDYFTSLLYRAYAMVGDSQLPAQYDTDYTLHEDTLLFIEVSRAWGGLTATQRQMLLPYVARPTDPASIYSRPGTLHDDGVLADTPMDVACPPNSVTGDADWRNTETAHFMIWSCGSGDPDIDPYKDERAITGAITEQVWSAETPGMGPPRCDDSTGCPSVAGKIDVYLLQQQQCIQRADECHALDGALAAASPDSPCDNSKGPLTSSGFLMLRLAAVPSGVPDAGTMTKIRSDFAHEFFHLLSFAQNLEGQGGGCEDDMPTGRTSLSWLTESSATWAEWAYTQPDDPTYRQRRFDGFQGRKRSSEPLYEIKKDGANVSYDAFVAPLSLCEAGGGKSTIESFWTSCGSARNPDALEDLVDTRFPYQDQFRDFAVRMNNQELDGLPGGLILHDVDSALPTNDGPKHMLPPMSLPPGSFDIPFKAQIARSAAQYQAFTVPDQVRWVSIDLGGGKLSIDALASVNGKWSRRRPEGTRFVFCRDDAADDISAFTLIISNYEHKKGNPTLIDYKVKVREVCPANQFTGWIKSSRTTMSGGTYMGETTDRNESYQETWTLSDALDPSETFGMPGANSTWNGNYMDHESGFVTPCSPGGGKGSTTDGSNSNTHLTPLVMTPLPGNGYFVSALHPEQLGMIDVPITTVIEYCDGGSYTTMADHTENESFAAIQSALMLMPMPNDPNHFVGKYVLAHSDSTGPQGEEIIDWTVTWDITRIPGH